MEQTVSTHHLRKKINCVVLFSLFKASQASKPSTTLPHLFHDNPHKKSKIAMR
jgi:hypothetical protein